jgi:anti-sigma B factor antagonist
MASDPLIDPAGDASIGARTLSLHTYAWEDATVVCCTGRLTTETSALLKTEVKPLLLNKRRVILDLTELAHMDSSGLGALVGLYITAKGASCTLQLVNLSPRIRELLSLTNVLSVFETCGRYGTRMP